MPTSASSPTNAYAGGLDYDWRLSPMYSITGYVAGSHIAGNTEAIQRLQENNVHSFQRPDADYIGVDPNATTLQGHAGSVSFGKISGESTRFSSYVGYKSPGFDTNDLGFMRRADEKNQSNWFQWRNFKPGKYVRTRNFNINQYAGWNFGGDRTVFGRQHQLALDVHELLQHRRRLQPRRRAVPRSRDARRSRRARQSEQVQRLVLREHRQPQGAVVLLQRQPLGRHARTARGTDINPGVNWRATSSMSLNLGFRYSINHDDSQWVTNEDLRDGGQRYVFGRIDQKTVSFTTRFNYTMTPTLSLQVYAEPFVSAGEYSNYKELVDGRAEKYEDRYKPYAYGSSADFNIRSFRTTNVLRWEYRPGSQLFLVWQQGKSDDQEYGDFRFGRDFGGVFSAPSHNVFLVKFSYWLNM